MKREEKGADCITREEYLEYLIHTYQNLIFSICLKSVGNPFDAEDLTQDVFLSAYKDLSRFDGTYEKAWLSKIAVRKCLDHLKAAGRRTIPTEDTYFEQLHDKEFSGGGISGQRFQGSDPAFMFSAEKPLQGGCP